MIKLYGRTVKELVMAVIGLHRYENPTSISRISDDFRRGNYRSQWEGLTSTESDQLSNISYEARGSTSNSKELIKELLEALSAEADATAEQESAVDAIARILMLPRGYFKFNSAVIQALQKALLVPEEIRKLKQELAKTQLGCSGCGRVIHPGQIMSFHKAGDGMDMLYCNVCQPPTLVTCNSVGCNEWVQIKVSYRPGVSYWCNTHTPDKKVAPEKPKGEAGIFSTAVAERLQELTNRTAQARVRVGNPRVVQAGQNMRQEAQDLRIDDWVVFGNTGTATANGMVTAATPPLVTVEDRRNRGGQ